MELTRQGKPHDAGRIVAELRFGFWTALLSAPYHNSFWMPGRATLLRTAFRHMPPSQRLRKDIHTRFNDLRLLRNRVFHYESILRRPLIAEHAQLREAIGWISPAMVDIIALVDRFPDIFASEEQRIAARVTTHVVRRSR